MISVEIFAMNTRFDGIELVRWFKNKLTDTSDGIFPIVDGIPPLSKFSDLIFSNEIIIFKKRIIHEQWIVRYKSSSKSDWSEPIDEGILPVKVFLDLIIHRHKEKREEKRGQRREEIHFQILKRCCCSNAWRNWCWYAISCQIKCFQHTHLANCWWYLSLQWIIRSMIKKEKW